MTGVISRIIDHALAPATGLQPRLRGRFEPLPSPREPAGPMTREELLGSPVERSEAARLPMPVPDPPSSAAARATPRPPESAAAAARGEPGEARARGRAAPTTADRPDGPAVARRAEVRTSDRRTSSPATSVPLPEPPRPRRSVPAPDPPDIGVAAEHDAPPAVPAAAAIGRGELQGAIQAAEGTDSPAAGSTGRPAKGPAGSGRDRSGRDRSGAVPTVAQPPSQRPPAPPRVIDADSRPAIVGTSRPVRALVPELEDSEGWRPIPAPRPAPIVRVSIGRIEVRAVTPAMPTPTPRRPANPASLAPSLADYLRARSGRPATR
jgi:hypothetical protein